MKTRRSLHRRLAPLGAGRKVSISTVPFPVAGSTLVSGVPHLGLGEGRILVPLGPCEDAGIKRGLMEEIFQRSA